MAIDLLNRDDRYRILKDIESDENKARKAESLKQYEIFSDRQHKYVVEYLESQFSKKTVREMPIISSINLARRCVTAEASIYRTSPERTFHDTASDDQAQALLDLYSDNGFDDRFSQANRYFKLASNQAHIQWVLKDGAIKPRVLLGHHLDVIPNEDDPEMGDVYIISAFNKQEYLNHSDGVNQSIADKDDYKKALQRFIVWSKDYNFIMNGKAEILSEEIENPIGIVPIVDISGAKDFEYWVRQGQSVTDFSVQFNAMISDVANVVRMQGWGQAVVSGDKSLLPESFVIGMNKIIHLPIDANNPTNPDFKYVTPNADIQGSLDFLKTNLSMFLSSRGIDPDTISFDGAGKTFSSGIERMLSMIQKFEASKADMDLFEKAEHQSFDIIRAYQNTYYRTDLLTDKNSIGEIPAAAYLNVHYAEPQMLKTEAEELDLIAKRIASGMTSQIQEYMSYHGVDETEAVKKLAEINAEKQARIPAALRGVNGDQESDSNRD
jgi:hypothetical protein